MAAVSLPPTSTRAGNVAEGVVTVVVVDDTPDLRMLTRMALELDSGVRVVGEAENGREGIEVVDLHQPDVVVLDMAMPIMDGLEALPHLRRVCPSARVLVVSAFDSGTVSASAVDAGADGYVQKGVSPLDLLEQVRALAAMTRPAAAPPVTPADRTP